MTGAKEPRLRGAFNRVLQLLARIAPGEQSVRVILHRARGVRIGKAVKIGYDVVLENARPDLINIDDGAFIGMRVTIIAHFKEFGGVRIGKDAFIGPGSIILPKVTIGAGAVILAGTVVSQSVPPFTVVQGNPAVPIARCEIPLGPDITFKAFSRVVKPLVPSSNRKTSNTANEESGEEVCSGT